ncbi:MAG: anti-sigma factor domain-containing protein [Burkholderiales bacterium]|jgi:anti-sigma-K factor RskA
MKYDDPELLDRLAGEYVFGSLSSRARRRFERLRRELPAAEKAALDWERRLMPLSGSVPAERPPARVWSAIDARTAGGARRASTGAWSWRRPAMGFAFGILATVGVIELFPQATLIESIVQERGTLPQSYAGLLTDAQNNVVLVASSMRYGRVLSVKWLRPANVPSGSVAVLWALPRDGAPFAVGVVPAEDKATVVLADTSDKLFSNVERLAVSFETGVPAPGATPSPFVLAGHCVKLW